jgi:protein involved in polysaccharide export with SLBB domain
MCSKKISFFRTSAGCVLAKCRQLCHMEGFQFRTWGAMCALLICATFLNAANLTTNTITSSTNVARSGVATQTFDLDDQHKIRPGDKLSFRVAEDREEAKPLTVTDSGEVELPSPFGRFNASGKTCRVLATEIKSSLEKEYYKRATVILGLDAMNNVRGQAYVSGQVSKPGPVNIPANAALTLSQAILIAGPPTQWAKLNAVKVVRKKAGQSTQTMQVDVDAILNKGRIEKDITVEPDDLIIVPERGILLGG